MATKRTKPERVSVRKTWKLYSGGAFIRSESGHSLAFTPSRGGRVVNVPRTSRKDVRNTVVAARKAQGGWAARTAFNRSQILYRIAEMLESREATFRALLEGAHGLRPADAQAEVAAAVDRLVYFAGWCDKIPQVFGGPNPVAGPWFNLTTPEPLGVVLAFPQADAPLLGLVDALAPVLATGCTGIAIVDPESACAALEFGEVLHTSDVPGGVANVLTGLREELLVHAAGHRDVDLLMGVGLEADERTALQREAAESVTRVMLDDALPPEKLRDDEAHRPWRLVHFLEMKTAWHPIGA